MSIVVLANGREYRVEDFTGLRTGVLNGRERSILPLVPLVEESEFDAVRAEFAEPANTERIKLYYHENNLGLTEEQRGDSICEVFEGYTLRGEWPEVPVILKEGTPDSPPVYGRRLTIEMGQRQYGEA